MTKIEGFCENPQTSWTLPGRYYHDAAVYEEEKEKIFYRTWQYAGHVCMLAEPRSYIVRDIADESIIVLRDGEGVLKAFYNVCQHRAHRLLEGEGAVRGTITCPYHNWTYDLDGKLRGGRGVAASGDLKESHICLKTVQVEEMCGFIFVNLDPDASSLAEQAAGLADEILSFSPNAAKLKRAYRREYPVKANWKNSVENFSECYHCPNQHRALSEGVFDIETYRIDTHPGYHAHRSRDRGDGVAYGKDASAARGDEFGGWLIWPNVSLEVFPGGNLNIFHHIPVSPEETLQVVEWYFASEELGPAEQEVIDFMHTVREEDIPLCESVQKGLHSKGYGQGRFVVDDGRTDVSEHAVHDFQLKVARALGQYA